MLSDSILDSFDPRALFLCSDVLEALTRTLLLWLLWRLWAFTVRPALYSFEPKELPYWIPVIGHGIEFMNNTDRLLARAQQYVGDSGEPFALTIFGQRCYFATSPKDIAAVYKNTTALIWDEQLKAIYLSFGIPRSTLERMLETPAPAGPGRTLVAHNPRHKSFFHLVDDLFKHQLHLGEELSKLRARFIPRLENGMRLESLAGEYVLKASGEFKDVSLFGWCQDLLWDAASRAYFGDGLLKLNPNLYKDFAMFDYDSWKIFACLPRAFHGRLSTVQARLEETFLAYIKLPKHERQGEAWFLHTVETEARNLDIGEDTMAVMMLISYWALNTNTYKLCFWLVSYILNDTTLLARIRAEVDLVMASGAYDVDRMIQDCPLLESCYYEALRVASSPLSVRNVVQPTELGGKMLQAGKRVLLSYRRLHMNKKHYGPDVEHFVPDRFMENKDLSRSPWFRPFSGGAAYCPGRFMAKQEAITFVALAVHRFDLELPDLEPVPGGRATPQKFPVFCPWGTVSAVLLPENGASYVVRVRERQTSK